MNIKTNPEGLSQELEKHLEEYSVLSFYFLFFLRLQVAEADPPLSVKEGKHWKIPTAYVFLGGTKKD